MDADPFQRLPEDVLILIFQKLPNDLKFLIQCSLVSHLFASVILLIPAVKLNIPSFFSGGGCLMMEYSKSQLMSRYARSTNSLRKFIHLRSLDLETDNSFGNWVKASKAARCRRFVRGRYLLSCVEADLWHDLLFKIIQDFPMLQSVGISDSYLSIYLRGEDLIKFKEFSARGEDISLWKIISHLFLQRWGI